MYILVFRQLVVMLSIAVISFFFARKNYCTDAVSQFLSKLLLFVISPSIIIHSFNMPYNKEKLRQLLVVFAISLAVHFVMIFIGHISLRSKNDTIRRQNDLDRLAIVFTNAGFLGIPLIFGIYGGEGVFLLVGYFAAYNIVFWTYGVYQMEHHVKLQNILMNPNTIAFTLGFILFCMPFQLPSIIEGIITPIVNMTTAAAMMLLGILYAIFSQSKEGIRKHIRRLSTTSFIRLLISPLFVLIVLWIFEKLFFEVPDIRKILFVVLIAAACPVGTSITGFAVLYKRDTSYASILVLFTSALCILTLPIFVRMAGIFL